MLANLLISLGLTRDSQIWNWSRVIAIAWLVVAPGTDLIGIAGWLGIPLSPVWAHRLVAAAIVVLWFSGNYDASKLPGKPKP